MFDFQRITGCESSKADNFSSLCNRLVMKLYPEAQPVDGSGGDEGLDTVIGTINGKCHVFQHKYFPDRIRTPQRKQIEQSLATAVRKHEVALWTAMVPCDLNTSELRWFQQLRAKYDPISLVWWGKTKLQDLLALYTDIARDFSPAPSVVVVVVNQTAAISDVSDAVLFDVINNAVGGGLDNAIKRPVDILAAAAETIRRNVPLQVLLWGPGPNGGDLYEKRVQLRTRLRQLGHYVDFSEDVCSPSSLQAGGLNLTVAELVQAHAYDYIVCLMASPGSIGEVHDFAKYKQIAARMMICVDRDHRSGYSAQGVLRIFEGHNGRLDWFERPTDLQDCHLVTRVLDQIQKVSEAKQWELVSRGLT